MTRPPIWFRGVLALLPRDFRERHGEEIVDLATRYAHGRSWLGRTGIWLRAAIDLLAVGLGSRARMSDAFRRDVHTGLRSLRRDPAFALFAVAMIGLGVGSSVTVYSVARALLLRPLPFAEPERLVWISNGDFGRGQALSSISVQSGQLEPLRNASSQFDDVGGYHLFDRAGDHTLRVGESSIRATRLRVTPNVFDVLGVQPAAGRLFAPDEVVDDAPPAVLLTHGSWMRLFDGRGDVVGGTVTLDDAPATVVGVLPASFDFTQIFAPGSRIDYVAPFPLTERSNRSGNTLGLIGRLSPGATVASAQAEAEALVRTDVGNTFDPVVRPLRDHLAGGFRPTVALLAASVGLVLLLVCANLSNLLLARGANRRRELSIRAALGAGRRRLVSQLLTESLILAGTGAVLGVALAVAGTRILAVQELGIPLLGQTRVDGWALSLALVGSVGVALLFGVAPALRSTADDAGGSLRGATRGASQDRRSSGLQRMLVVSQLAIACLLLAISTLTARSLLRLSDTDLGYDPTGRIAIRIDPVARFADSEERQAYYGGILDRVRAEPAVAAAGLTDLVPMAFNRRWGFDVEGRPDLGEVLPFVRIVSDGYVSAMGIEVLEGRDFTPADGPGAPGVALVNETLARRIWPDDGAVGARAHSSGYDVEIVGVVRSTRQQSVDQEGGFELFLPMRQVGDHRAAYLVVQGDRPTPELTAAARSAVGTVAPHVPLDQVLSLDAVVGGSLAPRRFLAALLAGFAVFALVLAALGVYAVVSYSVARRRREIGIRVALGATHDQVVVGLVRDGFVMTILGLGVGLLGSLLLSGALRGLLYGIEPTDPGTLLGAACTLALIATAASWLPARRALAVNPVEAVKGDE